MAEFIRKRQRVHVEECRLVYSTDVKRGIGFSFPCDRNGALLLGKLSIEALANLQRCRESDIVPHFEDRSYDYWEDAVIKCVRCGGEVVLHGFTNTCECCLGFGYITDYSMSGQLLAPRSQWGEETNETASEILMGGEDWE